VKLALKPYIEPVVEKPSCVSCRTFAPDCLVPVGDDESVQMCWLCAHHVVEHEVAVHHAHAGECECVPGNIYPAHVMAARRPAVTKPDPPSPRTVERDALLGGPQKRLVEWAREAHKQMSESQHTAIKKRLGRG
jgi:hypothetical protein